MKSGNDLEWFIDEQLRRLPEREAPPDLLPNVLAAAAAREARPWWRQPFTAWPKACQAVLFAFLLTLLGSVAYAVSGPAEQLSLEVLYERAVSLGWVTGVAQALGGALFAALREAGYWLLAAGAVVGLMYAACIAGGFALYRITRTHSLRQG